MIDLNASGRSRAACAALMSIALFAAACGDDDEKTEPPPGPQPFTQADLAGEWRQTVLRAGGATQTGGAAGWIRTRSRIDASGNFTISEYVDSLGFTQIPVANVQLALASDGVVTQPVGPLVRYRGRLNTARDLLVATATQTGLMTIRVTQRVVPGTTYTQSDLTGTWRYHAFGGGNLLRWEHGTVTVAADGSASRSDIVSTESGPSEEPDAGKLLLSSDGFMTMEGNTDPSWSAFMSADKSLIVASHTADAGAHEAEIVLITRAGSAFAADDLSGDWQVHMLNQNLTHASSWAHTGATFSSGGGVAFQGWEDSSGGTTAPSPAPTVALASDGTVTQLPAGNSYHGTLSTDRKLMIATTDRDEGSEATLFVSVR